MGLHHFSIRAVSFVLFSCGNSSNTEENKSIVKDLEYDTNKSKTIAIDDKMVSFDVDEKVDSVQYIKLQTTEESLIGTISKLVIEGERIFIHDRTGDQIVSFDLKGNYLYKISGPGRGSNEYVRIHDFAVNNDSLLIYDNLSMKILIYNSEGEFLRTVRALFNFREFIGFGNGLCAYAIRSSDNTRFPSINGFALAIGTLDTVLYRGMENNRLTKRWSKTASNTLFKRDSSVFFSPFLSNDIFEITRKGDVGLAYQLQYKNGLPKNYPEKASAKGFDKFVEKGSYTYFMGNFKENSNHIYVRFTPPTEYYKYALIDKKNMKSISFEDFTNSTKHLGYNHPISVYKDRFVAVIQPQDILRNNGAEKIERHIGKLSAFGNPVILLYQYK